MRAVAIAGVMLALLGGCASDDPNLPAAAPSSDRSEQTAPSLSNVPPDTSGEALSNESCKLIKARDASAALGQEVESSPDDMGACYYSAAGIGEVGVLVPEEDIGDFDEQREEAKAAAARDPSLDLRVFRDIGDDAFANYTETQGTRFYIGYVRVSGRFTSVSFFPPEEATTDDGWASFERLLEVVARRL